MEDNTLLLIQNTGKGSVTLAVITTLFITARFISLLRGFDRTGWLVAVLIQNFLDVRGFIVVIVSILFGFTVAFRLLFAGVEGECIVNLDESNVLHNECDDPSFGTLGRSLLSTFELTILGSYEPTLMFESNQMILSSVVFVIAVTVILVVALNALIAVLSDSFSRVQENVTANRRRERAELIVAYLSMMPSRQRKKIEKNNQYFHALLASDGHGDLLMHKDDWQGGLNALKRELTEMADSNNQITHRELTRLREELRDEVANMMKNEIGLMLNDIFMEVKEISKSQRTGQLPTSKKVLNAVQLMQRNFAPLDGIHRPFDGIRRKLLRPLPIINKRNHQENIVQSENNNNDVATIQRTEEEIPEDEFQEISLDSLDDNNADEYPNLMSSATFG
jgi:F0F1-type ATP synthase membrane subunit b/b'